MSSALSQRHSNKTSFLLGFFFYLPGKSKKCGRFSFFIYFKLFGILWEFTV